MNRKSALKVSANSVAALEGLGLAALLLLQADLWRIAPGLCAELGRRLAAALARGR